MKLPKDDICIISIVRPKHNWHVLIVDQTVHKSTLDRLGLRRSDCQQKSTYIVFFNVPLRHFAAVRLSSLSVEFLTIHLRTTVGLEGLTWPLALDTIIRTENLLLYYYRCD